MEFNFFKNKTDYLEYLQIFVFNELIMKNNQSIDVDHYQTFELTDKIIESYNKWIAGNGFLNSKLVLWFKNNSDKVEYFKSNFNSKFEPKVSIWSDRKKTEYYKKKLQASFIFENHIAKLISEKYGLDLGQYLSPEGQYELGENSLGIEIKNDTLISKYGNVYIEYQEKSKGSNYNFVNSGILKDDDCIYFLTGTPDNFYIFKKERLVDILNEEISNYKKSIVSKRGIIFKVISTSKGYVYPVKYAIKDTITMDEMISEIREKFKL